MFDTPKARTPSLFATLAVTDVLDIQAGVLADLRSGEYLAGRDASGPPDSARPS